MYMLVVLSGVYGASLAYDDGLTLRQCREEQTFLATRGEKNARCCLAPGVPTLIPSAAESEANAERCPAAISPFPYIEGDERLFGDMAARHLYRTR